jgi:hypothetical protein
MNSSGGKHLILFIIVRNSNAYYDFENLFVSRKLPTEPAPNQEVEN